jgi:hypothetical protein
MSNFELEEEVSALKLLGCEPPIEELTKMRDVKMETKKKKERSKKKKLIE